MKMGLGIVAEMMNVDAVDGETTRMVERIIISRLSTKDLNLWMRQLEMKRKEITSLAQLLKLDGVKNEIETEK